MLLSVTLPFVNSWLVNVLEREQKLLSISKELVLSIPGFEAETAKLVATLVLDYQQSCVMLLTFLKESYERASIGVHVEDAFPVTRPVKTRHTAYQIRNLHVTQNARMVGLFGHVLYQLIVFGLFLSFYVGIR